VEIALLFLLVEDPFSSKISKYHSFYHKLNYILKSLINELTRIKEYGGKNATLLAYLLSKSINEYGGILCLLHEKLKVWWNFFPKKQSEHARLFETSEY
jgi:hypothetical protein